ncbi:M15 family metallopeptidase [Sphingosinicella rhizophila]|uniref:D-alanyl-D-alanine dipeptidase n=1 Tax=Sphingosinicella rhizophila TaxID=3050082 RepID=A0ABU3QBH0_9SPHN|nr:M15 family metallopeptidase [Sphingosinicella sp. GR2756]MDT9600358.1 M15 family metallopeptidase [Sphingosinicella sp. GR2756]
MSAGLEFERHAARPAFLKVLLLSLGLAASTLALGACKAPEREASSSEAPAAALGLVGMYGEGDSLIDISERDGRLYADGRGFKDSALAPKGNAYELADPEGGASVTVTVEGDAGAPSAIVLAGQRLPRRDPGKKVEDRIRVGINGDVSALRAAALKASPPAEPRPERDEELVDLSTLVPNIKVETRYASTNNFLGLPVYEVPGAFLQKPAAEALVEVARALEPLGYGIKVLDGYRPWHVTKMFWDATPETSHMFVADPSQGSRHNRGSAIDMTMYRLDTGEEVEMPGRYDEMSLRSYADYKGGTTRQRKERDILRREMEKQGFKVYPEEWWHFDHQDWQKYGILNLTLTELKARNR